MPEGDTIFRAARTLQRALAGREVLKFDARLAQVADVDRAAPLRGRKVEAVRAHGKHLLMHFSGGLVLRTHMRMNGSWHVYRVGERWRRAAWRARVVIETDAFVAVAFDVQDAELMSAPSAARHDVLRRLGPDLLREDFSEDEVLRRLRARPEATLADALLDQKVMAGAGNVYKSEILFAVRLHPFRRVASVDEETLRRMIQVARKYLAANVLDDTGEAMVTYTGYRRTTGRADPSERLWVYGRMGRPCRVCGTPIEMERRGAAARSTYFCPRCQPAADRDEAWLR